MLLLLLLLLLLFLVVVVVSSDHHISALLLTSSVEAAAGLPICKCRCLVTRATMACWRTCGALVLPVLLRAAAALAPCCHSLPCNPSAQA